MNDSETKLFNGFTLALGLFAGALFAAGASLAAKALDRSQHPAAEAEEARLAVEARISPIARVAMTGDESLAAAAAAIAAAAARPASAEPLTGETVVSQACSACHAPPGVPGAPLLGDVAAWSARVAQGADTLYDHAINGFQGAQGIMPAKGGRLDLSDAEIQDAVDWMLEQLPPQ